MSNETGKPQGYEDLLVWQKAITLVKRIYNITKTFPDDEKFGLTSQMRRAAVSIPSNIAEGQARAGTREFLRFVSHAEGSTAELATQATIAVELGYTDKAAVADIFTLLTEERKMLNALRLALKRKLRAQQKGPST